MYKYTYSFFCLYWFLNSIVFVSMCLRDGLFAWTSTHWTSWTTTQMLCSWNMHCIGSWDKTALSHQKPLHPIWRLTNTSRWAGQFLKLKVRWLIQSLKHLTKMPSWLNSCSCSMTSTIHTHWKTTYYTTLLGTLFDHFWQKFLVRHAKGNYCLILLMLMLHKCLQTPCVPNSQPSSKEGD